jgi:hypothetical protein
MKDYKYQEIADEFNLPLGTVKSRIFFARKALKDMIKENYGDYSLVRSLVCIEFHLHKNNFFWRS